MKNLQFNHYQCGARRVGSKKYKFIPAPPPLWDKESSCRAKREGVGQVGRGKIVISKEVV